MRHIKTKIAQTILLAGISLFAFCTSALADMDWKRMKRDLAIQESILDQFFDGKKSFSPRVFTSSKITASCSLPATGYKNTRSECVRLVAKTLTFCK